MKFKLPVSVCVLISLALVIFGLLFGTMSGFADERRQVTSLLEGENGLMDVLRYRGADGLNLCVVARRHLSGDESVAALEAASNTLRSERESLSDKNTQNAKLDEAVAAVSAKLHESATFQQSERDQKYLDMLSTDMDNLSKSAMVDTYNAAASDFNKQLDTPLIGALAKLLGIEPCELYQ